MEKVSVIIPVYNGEKCISRCLESVLNQSYSLVEIIAVDDASTDNSVKVLELIKEANNNVIILKNSLLFLFVLYLLIFYSFYALNMNIDICNI